MAKKWLSLRSLWTDVSEGNHSDAFFAHLAESDLPVDLKIEALALAVENAASRKEEEAKVVGRSTVGVESLAGDASFEKERALSLKALATQLRSLIK